MGDKDSKSSKQELRELTERAVEEAMKKGIPIQQCRESRKHPRSHSVNYTGCVGGIHGRPW